MERRKQKDKKLKLNNFYFTRVVLVICPEAANGVNL